MLTITYEGLGADIPGWSEKVVFFHSLESGGVYTRPQTSSQWVYNDIQIPLRKNCFRGSNLGESTIVYCY